MLRQKGFSIINIAGLTIGITCSLLIILYIQDELSYDKFHSDAERIYRLGTKGVLEGKKINSAQTGVKVAEGLEQDISEIESTVRIASWETFPVRYEDQSFTEAKLLLVDPNFFRFFNFKLIEGHPDSVLQGEGKVVMTESTAKRYFNYKGKGDRSPLGKTLILAQGYTAKVTGIAEDPPLNSHFHFTLLLSLSSYTSAEPGDYMTRRVFTYFKIKPGETTENVFVKFNKIIEYKIGAELEQVHHTTLADFKAAGNDVAFFSQPLLDIHLRSQLNDEIEPNSDVQYLYTFGIIALFITLLACINFMNLSTARSASRAKEVGIRKAVGAPYNRLVTQFLLESYLFIILAVVISLLLIIAILPIFNYFTHKQLSISVLVQPAFLGLTIGCIVLSGLLAGSYPAFYLSHFSPVEVLKGKLREQLRSYGIRNGLVIFQFFISSVLIVSTLVVYLQIRYIQQANVGFDKANVINLLHTRNLGKNGVAFKKELLSHVEIVSASYASRLPPNIDWQYLFRLVDTEKEYLFNVYEVDWDHQETMRYEMVAGRFFSEQNPADTNAVILNETAARQLGLTIFKGKKLFSTYDHSNREREIIGIIKDFNFASLKEPIQPLAITLGPQPNWEIGIRLSPGNTQEKIGLIKSIWNKYANHAPFEYTFLDKNFEATHKTEKRIGFIFLLFTSLAIFIACLGLFGLATFTAEQRTKEIGIRKVVGASIQDIVLMINQDFMKLVGVANLLAWPVAWWIMHSWLTQFAFRISFPWWSLLFACIITLLIAFISISFQAVRAARGNPVKSLRNE
ncbi:ABC transporter permease [Chryseolinea sp. H1M3-3]|uniref:ABC transporter permease n=1 Tax=Chryseolinea sp. H1M3-3 TaxID=3034144 RepID=UPI0023ED4F19|nr:ABC transporter permease [Chryseolinea sp. H1M3-3]